MRVFVTGHKGFIGKNFIESIPSDWCISMFDIVDNPTARPSDLYLEKQNLDAVIHLGAISSTTETNVKKVIDNNLSWSIELAEICKENNILFQFSSSASVYGKADALMKETDVCKPLNIYAQSKYLFEQYLLTQDKSFAWQAFRYFNVYGPHEEHKNKQASPYTQFEKQARENGVIKIFEGSQNFKRDFIHVNRIIDLHMKFLDVKDSGVWNFGLGSTKSFYDIAKEMADKYNAKIEYVSMPSELKAHYQKYTCADITKLKATLNENFIN